MGIRRRARLRLWLRRVPVALPLLAAALGCAPRAGSAETLSLGFRTAVDLARVTIEGLGTGEENSARWGAGLGAKVTFPLGTVLALESGLNYSIKGTKYTYQGPLLVGNQQTDGRQEITTRLGYLTVPVMARLLIPPVGLAHPYLKAGPEIGLCVSAKAKEEDTLVDGRRGSAEENIKDQINAFDMGLGFGGGVGLRVAPKVDLFGELGYTIGLMDVSDEPAGVVEESNKNRVFDAAVGLMVRI